MPRPHTRVNDYIKINIPILLQVEDWLHLSAIIAYAPDREVFAAAVPNDEHIGMIISDIIEGARCDGHIDNPQEFFSTNGKTPREIFYYPETAPAKGGAK